MQSSCEGHIIGSGKRMDQVLCPKKSDLQFALVMALKCPKIALVLQIKISPRMAYYMSWQANGSSFMPKNRKMRRNRHPYTTAVNLDFPAKLNFGPDVTSIFVG